MFNMKAAVKKHAKTTVVTIIAIITALWNTLTENAELFGLSSQVIMIGAIVLAAIAMVVNMLTSNQE
ncbi:hypothetical protein [Bizionia myxarmorum]|uniref:Holin n=1 Tax=Bizionia myxarmorum TaxID=291186 RepID=A0A5D0RA03_9FLAO|nr:hypothetical protein [Bizionia myxarmorum]TYB78342.1 hypothetical protein ES674_00750 [Bizionia myxarmorum]